MQHDPSKQGNNNNANMYGNQYPPMNQPQYGAGNPYPPHNAPPPYSQHPQQPVSGVGYGAPGTSYYGPTPVYQQPGVIVTPLYRPFWNNLVQTPITPSLKQFLIISGILYLIWGILSFGLEIGIIVNSYSSFYIGIWAGAFLIGGGVSMLVAACRPSYAMISLVRMFTIDLVFCILGVILALVKYLVSNRCSSGIWDYFYCDKQIAINLKGVSLGIFIVATIHTIVNLVLINNTQKRTLATPASNVPGQ